MNVLITGHEGYIGSVLTPLILSMGHQVTGVDVGFFRDERKQSISPLFTSKTKDVRDLELTDLEGVDAVIHLAALSNDPMGNLKPELTDQINHLASIRLARLSKEAGVKRFLFSSSCSVYGVATPGALADEESALRPLTAYAVSKVQTEEDVARLADATFCPIFLRNATVYGWSPRFRSDLVLNNLAGWAYTTGEIRIMSDGTPWRPIVHIEDVAHAFIALLEAPVEDVYNQVFNVGANDQNYQVMELADLVHHAFPNCKVSFAESSGPDPRSYRVNFSKIARCVPTFHPVWDAGKGALQLALEYPKVGLTFDEFNGPRYVRLARLKELMETGQLDADLRWKTTESSYGR